VDLETSQPHRMDCLRICQHGLQGLSDLLPGNAGVRRIRTPNALPAAGPLPHGPHLEADFYAWHNHLTPTFGCDTRAMIPIVEALPFRAIWSPM